MQRSGDTGNAISLTLGYWTRKTHGKFCTTGTKREERPDKLQRFRTSEVLRPVLKWVDT